MGAKTTGGERPGAGGKLPRRAAPFAARKPRLLAVDDDAVNLKLLAAMLGRSYTVHSAHDAEEAAKMFAKGGYSLVLLDLHMPGTSGYDCARRLRRIEEENGWKRLPLLAITADNTPEAAQQSVEAGMDAVVLKPIEFRELLTVTGKWCKAAKSRA